LLQLETYHGPGEKEHHGHDGPIHVSDGGFRGKYAEDEFMKAAQEVGYPEIEDLQTLDNNNGVQRWQRYVSPDGKRQDTAHRYIHPKLEGGKHSNLHVLVESKVVKVIFDENKRAVGVEYTPNPEFQAVIGLTAHPVQTVKARKQSLRRPVFRFLRSCLVLAKITRIISSFSTHTRPVWSQTKLSMAF
jgi:alcohol oxidase